MPPEREHLANLLRRAQGGDAAALHLLCKSLEDVMARYFRSRFQDRDIVNDLCQETYLRLLNNLASINEPMKLKSFVLKVAYHVMNDFLRQKYRRREDDMADEALESATVSGEAAISSRPEEQTNRLLNEIDLRDAMEQLPQKTRQILLLKAEGYKYDEIARELDLSVSGVKMQVKRGMERLKVSLFAVTFLIHVTTTLMKGR